MKSSSSIFQLLMFFDCLSYLYSAPALHRAYTVSPQLNTSLVLMTSDPEL
jgi:hypothetical protein